MLLHQRPFFDLIADIIPPCCTNNNGNTGRKHGWQIAEKCLPNGEIDNGIAALKNFRNNRGIYIENCRSSMTARLTDHLSHLTTHPAISYKSKPHTYYYT